MALRSHRCLGVAVTVAALALGPAALPAHAATVEIQVVGVNDFHGRLLPLEDNDTPEDASDDSGGAVQLAGAVAQYTAANPSTVFVSAGDNIGASTFVSNVQQDSPTLEALNQAGLAVSAVGNHEFDRGFDDIAVGGRVDDEADFPYLGANVYAEGTQDVVLEEYAVEDVGGVDVGFVGVVTEQTASLVAPEGIADIDFGDPTDAASRVAAQLRDGDGDNGEADVVVLLIHEGSSAEDCAAIATEGAFGEVVQGVSGDVDAILSGHTHQQYSCVYDTAQAGGFVGPVVQGGQYGEALSSVTLSYDDVAGEVTGGTGAVVELTGFPSDANPEVAQTVAEAAAFAEEAGSQELGVITADITRARDAAGEEDRGSESALGNFIADVQLTQTRDAGAQIALMNPGGLRADFLVDDQFGSEAPGVVTLGEANAVQPFANGVVTMTLTGAQVESVLEEQWQPEGSSRPFLALGLSKGLSYTFDASAAAGSRVVSVTLEGQPLDPAATYRVTVNSFLASGGDNFTTLAEGTDRQELGVTDLEALVAYFEDNSPVTADAAPRRAVAVGGPAPVAPTTPAVTPRPNAPRAVVPPATRPAGTPARNPGLRVNTGVTSAAAPADQAAVVLGLTGLAGAAGLALVVRRRRPGAHH